VSKFRVWIYPTKYLGHGFFLGDYLLLLKFYYWYLYFLGRYLPFYLHWYLRVCVPGKTERPGFVVARKA